MNIFISIILILMFLTSALVGWKLRHGKWLRFMAGNTFPILSKDKQLKLGKIAGITFYIVSIFPIALLVFINIDTQNDGIMALLIVLSMIIFVVVPTIYAMRKASQIK